MASKGSNVDKWYQTGYQAALRDIFDVYLREGADIDHGARAAIVYVSENYHEAAQAIRLHLAKERQA